jgi:phosphatidylglycerol:prolipoprotein diacylglycerol transferase
MHPILLSLGPITLLGHLVGPLRFYSYGLCLAAALGLSIYLFARDAGKYIGPKMKTSYEKAFQQTFDLAVWVIISSILGARVFYVWENYAEFTNGHWMEAFFIWQGGLVYYGGLFGALAAAVVWMRREKWPMLYAMDLVSPYILLGQAIGRVGCFMNGCCYGLVSEPHNGPFDWGHGWVFQGGEDALPHLPTQLWELGGDLGLFFVLLAIRRFTLRYPGLGLPLYGVTYGLLRFVIEFWRRSWDKRYLVFFNSASQAVSGIMIALSLAAIVWIVAKANRKAT